MSKYPKATWAPWAYGYPATDPTYYRGQNKPIAVVLHVAQGWMDTVLRWARDGHYGASWHYSVGRDGKVYQHLEHTDGGYHAGIERYRKDASGRIRGENPPPTWPLWRGWDINVNTYSIGIEHEGFSGQPLTTEQAAASRDLCRWLAAELGIPYDREHFTSHSEIALIDRSNDFNTPALREEHYRYMFEEDAMTDEERERLERVEAQAFYGVAYGFRVVNERLAALTAEIAALRAELKRD